MLDLDSDQKVWATTACKANKITAQGNALALQAVATLNRPLNIYKSQLGINIFVT